MPPDHPVSIQTDLTGVLLNNRYELLDKIGRGGMGAVYQSHDTMLKRDVAVKVLSEATLNEKHRSRLLREAQSVASLNHPNIVAVHDAGEHEGVPFIVMELVQGKPLDSYMPVTLERALELSLDICRALEHAHKHGVIHRDIKPENVLITETGETTKLVDFGLAYRDASRLTKEGEILGTLFYMAPEQITGGPVDARTDLYALGVLMYELTTHELPFSDNSPIALISHHLNSTADPPYLKRPSISASLNALIMTLMEKSPEDRPASAADVIQPLTTIIAEATAPSRQQRKYQSDLPDAPQVHFRDSIQDQLRAWKAQGQTVLDVTSMALLHHYPKDTAFDEEDLILVFRSALHLEMELEPWMDRAVSSQAAIGALDKILYEYPIPEIRQQIVTTLTRVPDEEATTVILRLAKEDDYHQVRSLAAVEASRRGHREPLVSTIIEDIQQGKDPVALAALVAIADEVGLPKDSDSYPRYQVLYALFQRRWRENKKTITRYAIRGGWRTGLFMLVLGLLTPLYTALVNPENYADALSLWTVPVWSLMGGASTLVIGGIQGYLSYLSVGTADMLWRGTQTRWGRYLFGAAAGLFFTLYEITFIMLNLYAIPRLGSIIYAPLLVLFGLILGFGLAVVIPPFYSQTHIRQQFLKVIGVAILLTGIATPLYWFLHLEFNPAVIVFRLLFVFVLTMGAGLSTIRKKEVQSR